MPQPPCARNAQGRPGCIGIPFTTPRAQPSQQAVQEPQVRSLLAMGRDDVEAAEPIGVTPWHFLNLRPLPQGQGSLGRAFTQVQRIRLAEERY